MPCPANPYLCPQIAYSKPVGKKTSGSTPTSDHKLPSSVQIPVSGYSPLLCDVSRAHALAQTAPHDAQSCDDTNPVASATALRVRTQVHSSATYSPLCIIGKRIIRILIYLDNCDHLSSVSRGALHNWDLQPGRRPLDEWLDQSPLNHGMASKDPRTINEPPDSTSIRDIRGIR